MDKSWIDWGTRCSKPYYEKLDEFLSFASASRDISSRIYYPCRKCENRDLFVIDIVREHFRDNGLWKKYKIWEKHGESRDYDGSLHREEALLGSDNYMDVDMVRLVEEALGTDMLQDRMLRMVAKKIQILLLVAQMSLLKSS
ncbi:hypothetical protein ACLB2K_002308 [Fragaria x ananassa]